MLCGDLRHNQQRGHKPHRPPGCFSRDLATQAFWVEGKTSSDSQPLGIKPNPAPDQLDKTSAALLWLRPELSQEERHGFLGGLSGNPGPPVSLWGLSQSPCHVCVTLKFLHMLLCVCVWGVMFGRSSFPKYQDLYLRAGWLALKTAGLGCL